MLLIGLCHIISLVREGLEFLIELIKTSLELGEVSLQDFSEIVPR